MTEDVESFRVRARQWLAANMPSTIFPAADRKPYRLNPRAISALSCGQTEPLW